MYIVHVGYSYFPKGTAAVQRMRVTYRALNEAGFSTLILNKESYHSGPGLKRVNRFEGIPYVYCCAAVERPKSWIGFRLNRVTGILGELKLLFKKRKQIGSIILYNTSSFSELLYYRLISWILGFRLVFQYVEYRSSFLKSSVARKINNYIFDNYSSYFTDGVIVISEFLKARVQEKNKSLPLVKIPAISDFEEFNLVPAAINEAPYLLYCGTVEYMPVINFVIELYEELRKKNLYNGCLKLIVSAVYQKNLLVLQHKIKASKYAGNITLHSGISYDQLIAFYKGADILLIPLRNTIQDTARFPHKISEYTASKRPLLSTNVGELKYYFEDGVTAILAEEYTIESYVKSLAQALAEQDALDTIGYNGFKIGLANFHYQSNTEKFKSFFEKLCTKKISRKMALTTAV